MAFLDLISVSGPCFFLFLLCALSLSHSLSLSMCLGFFLGLTLSLSLSLIFCCICPPPFKRRNIPHYLPLLFPFWDLGCLALSCCTAVVCVCVLLRRTKFPFLFSVGSHTCMDSHITYIHMLDYMCVVVIYKHSCDIYTRKNESNLKAKRKAREIEKRTRKSKESVVPPLVTALFCPALSALQNLSSCSQILQAFAKANHNPPLPSHHPRGP